MTTVASMRAHGNRWLPLWLLLAALAVPLFGFGIWKYRKACVCAYHVSCMRQALLAGADKELARHLYAAYRLAPSTLEQVLLGAKGWSPAQRRRLAEVVMEHPDFMRARSTYVPYDTMSRVFGGLYLLRPAVRPRLAVATVLALDAGNQDALRCRAEELYRDKDYRGCVTCLQRIDVVSRREGNTPSDRDYMLWGAALAELDRYREAGEKFGLAARMRPRSFIALAAQEQALARQGRYADAVQVCTRIMFKAQPRIPEAIPEIMIQRGQMFGLLGRRDLALKDLAAATGVARRQAAMRGRDLFDLRMEKVRALINMRAAAEALLELDQLGRKRAGDVEILLLRAYALADLERYRQAERCLREAMLDSPASPYLYNHLAWIKATARDKTFCDPPEALRLARKAFILDRGRSPAIMDTLAETCYVNRMFGEAVKYERMALAKGGECYRASMERFREAAARAARAEEVRLTPSPLLGHEKFPPLAPGQVLAVEKLRPPSRVSLQEYRAVLGRRLAGSGRRKVDELARYLALLWRGYPVAAVDDPRADFKALSVALLQLRWSARSRATASDRRFLLALATAFTEEGAMRRFPGITDAGTLARLDLSTALSEAVFAFRLVRMITKILSPVEAGRVLGALADGRFRFTQFYDPRWYAAATQGRGVGRRGEDLERAWSLVAARLRLAAAGKPLPDLRLQTPVPARPRPGLAPPPGD